MSEMSMSRRGMLAGSAGAAAGVLGTILAGEAASGGPSSTAPDIPATMTDWLDAVPAAKITTDPWYCSAIRLTTNRPKEAINPIEPVGSDWGKYCWTVISRENVWRG